jgi:hypothetical protein
MEEIMPTQNAVNAEWAIRHSNPSLRYKSEYNLKTVKVHTCVG